MAKFFLGQRVRLARPDQEENRGVTGRISALGYFADFTFLRGQFCEEGDCVVDWDKGGWSPQFTHQLEPILPSGHTASTESFQELMDRLNTQRVEKVEEVGA